MLLCLEPQDGRQAQTNLLSYGSHPAPKVFCIYLKTYKILWKILIIMLHEPTDPQGANNRMVISSKLANLS